ncbi:hypothetical protein GBA52_001679 [Prunus armeniaca]|nr:hypothetical protein GBA52_001679 [Prunus armeniaca]
MMIKHLLLLMVHSPWKSNTFPLAINNMHHHALVQYGGGRLQQQADNHFVTHIIQYLVQKTMTSSSVR